MATRVVHDLLPWFGFAGRGLLLGAGFTAGFLLVFGAGWPWLHASTEVRSDAQRRAAQVSRREIEVGPVRVHRGALLWFSATLTNRGSQTAHRIHYQARFHRDGTVVDICDAGSEEMLHAGQTRLVEFGCGRPGEPVAEHDGFEVVVLATDWL
jgi:hypothetical protein